jgi:hypothetical protein
MQQVMPRFRTYAGLVMAAFAALGVACDSPTRPTVADVGEPFSLKVGRSAEVGDIVTVKFERVVSDSRCPLDALCITAGSALIELQVSIGGDQATLGLTTDAPGWNVVHGGFLFRLVELQPYPRASMPTPARDYVVTLNVQTAP